MNVEGMTQVDAIVYLVHKYRREDDPYRRTVEAVFRWVSDAVKFVDAKVAEGPYRREDYEIENTIGQRIKGASRHGYAILDALYENERKTR